MANSNQNDIIINAKATTKDAEASISKLDAQVKALAANSPKVQALEHNLATVGNKAAKTAQSGLNMAKASETGFAALQGSLTGVLTKLGMLGLAIGAVKLVWDSYNAIQQRAIDNLNKVADSSNKYYSAFKEQSKSILDNLQQLNEIADGGYMDNESLKQTNSLVAQLNSLWGDVGLSVDQTTGKIAGLEQATKAINDNLRHLATEGAKARQEAARLALEQAQRNKGAEFNADGSMTIYGATRAAANFDNLTGFYTGGMSAGDIAGQRANELDAAIKSAQADLLAAEAEVKRLEAQTTQEQVSATVARGQKAIAAQNNLNNLQRNYTGIDLQELGLRQALAAAQASGGDVSGARAALETYQRGRDTDRYNALTREIEYDKQRQAYAQERYNVGLRHGDVEEITKRLEALIEANKTLEAHTAEASRLANGMYKPATPDKLPEAMRSVARGTFDVFGINGLGTGNIQQQQLDVQKQIARNTEQLAIPVVGE